ncbi:5'-methylthioadenosine/S-adenosylhomocysteine nucleosidase family protein [Lacrimispora brassicae]
MTSDIYYHFFDRELRETLNAALTDRLLVEIIEASLFMTEGLFYLPISNMFESGERFPKALELINKMDALGLIYPASSHPSRERFLLSRQELYRHDKERYPMYFGDDVNIWSDNIIILDGSTTKILKENFITDEVNVQEIIESDRKVIRKFIKQAVDEEEKAITYALFCPERLSTELNNQQTKVAMSYIRKKISENYIGRYLKAKQGTIITGIQSLQRFDYLSNQPFMTDFRIYKKMFQKCGVNLLSSNIDTLLLEIRNDFIDFHALYSIISSIIKAVTECTEGIQVGREKRLLDLLESNYVSTPVFTKGDLYRNFVLYRDSLCRSNKEIKEKLETMKEKSLVLVAVTKTEMKAIERAITTYFPKCFLQERVEPGLVYRELIGSKKPFYVVQSQMGAVGSGAMNNTIHVVCEVLNPEKIILGGIAFGANNKKQNIGDILVSKQIWNYESAKVTNEVIIDRGDKISASSYLLQLFNSTAINYEKADVRFGVIASGEKLVNSKELIQDLRNREPEFIGGDMEAAGLVSVCQDKRVDWIVVKAICDWGFNKKDTEQVKAAENAFDFIMYNVSKLI